METDNKNNGRKVVLIGLPHAGKSTFTAALWGVVRSRQIAGALSLVKYDGDDTYLNRLYAEWARGIEVTRTQIKTEGTGFLELANGKDSVGRVVIPDFAGERYDAQWEKRYITREHASHLATVDSVLFFVHSTRINYGQLNNKELAEMDNELFPDEHPTSPSEAPLSDSATSKSVIALEPEGAEKPEPNEQPFDPKLVPTQTILVDLLQSSLNIGTAIRRVAVIVSAWDLVEGEPPPSDWLKRELPLLGQYIASNSHRFEARIWGVSAQGGELGENSTEAERDAILAKAMNRIQVSDGSQMDSDITRPLKWLFGLN